MRVTKPCASSVVRCCWKSSGGPSTSRPAGRFPAGTSSIIDPHAKAASNYDFSPLLSCPRKRASNNSDIRAQNSRSSAPYGFVVILQIDILARLGQRRLAAAVSGAQVEHGAYAVHQDRALRRQTGFRRQQTVHHRAGDRRLNLRHVAQERLGSSVAIFWRQRAGETGEIALDEAFERLRIVRRPLPAGGERAALIGRKDVRTGVEHA